MGKRVLVVDDESLITWSLKKCLEKESYEVEIAETGKTALEKFRAFQPEMVLLDIMLPDANGIELLQTMKKFNAETAVIMITATAHVDSAVQAFKRGAEDFIGKPFNMDVVKNTVFEVFERKRLRKEADRMRSGLRKRFEEDRLVGNSPKMIEVFKMIRICAECDCKTVLILGESGTGKELVSKAIHQHSPRSDKPFIEINCAAIPENLLENELFGHEKGAYTDAGQKEKGIFEVARGGTVFLDEIGDMPLPMQAKILKVIETKRFRRLGGHEDIEADVRIIAATNQDLISMVEEKKFRGDLFFRLNVMRVNLPPLRERKEDLPHIVHYFIQRLNDEYGRLIEDISPEAMEDLKAYDWPGNIRELRNAIERAIMLEQGRRITSTHLPCEIRERGRKVSRKGSMGSGTEEELVLPKEGISMEKVEKLFIEQALARYGGNQTKAAKCLGMTRDTLRYRMKKFGIDEPSAESKEKRERIDTPFDPLGSINFQ